MFSQAPLSFGSIIDGVRVLVVEDDVKMAAAIRRGLRFEGLVVDLASGGEQALAMVGATEYDAVVLDVMMPEVDGFETVRRMRADGLWVPVLEAGSLRLDPATRQVWRGDREIELSAREFGLLETFMRRPGQVLTQPQLLEAAWDLGYEQRSNVVEVYVRYLREKIDRPFGVTSLETVRGVGYRLRKDGGM